MRWVLVFLIVPAAMAQTRPTTQIRRGIEYPTTDPARRQEIVFEGLIRKIEPDLHGEPSRMPAYVNFFKREFVRDPRLFAVDISVSVNDDTVQIDGFVEYAQHQEMLRRMLTTMGFEKIQDRIEVAHTSTSQFGVVTTPRAFLYDRIDQPRETITECLNGEPLFVLRKSGDYCLVHASDGYVGYVNATAFTLLGRKEFTDWMGARHAILRSAFAPLPVGGWVKVLAWGDPTVRAQTSLGTSVSLPVSSVVEVGSLAAMQKIEGAILAASKLMGTKYVWGGRTSDGIDCSGLTQLAFKTQGINLPRDADQQAYVGRFVATATYRDAMARGDLMFFLSRRGTIGHVAIYLGENQFIEAADEGVKISSLNPADQNYQAKRDRSFAFARRVVE
jgi:gamma-D-glutamyl-L-lysine dipeptidyl-peptidase